MYEDSDFLDNDHTVSLIDLVGYEFFLKKMMILNSSDRNLKKKVDRHW